MPAPTEYPQAPVTHEAMMATIDADAQAQAERDAAARKIIEDQALIKKWGERVKQGEKHDEAALKQYEQDRKYARGDLNWMVDTNLISAIIEILMAFIYAKDPDVSVRPAASIGQARLQKYAPVAKTIEVVLSRMFKRGRLKTQAKRWVRSMMTVGVGWITVSLQTRTEIDPIVESELSDLNTKLKQLDLQQAAVARGDAGNIDAAKSEIRNKITALQARRERQVDDGPVYDFRLAESVGVSPECGELENYLAAPWIRYYTYKTKEEAWAIVDWPSDEEEYIACMKGANLFMQRKKGADGTTTGDQTWSAVATDKDAQTTEGFVRFIEIWSKRDGLVYTLLDGVNKYWARAPYAPTTGERFYNGFMLGAHFMDGERHPQSDVFQLSKLQDEFGRARSNFALHRRRAIPATLFDGNQIDPETIKRIKDSETDEFVEVSTTNQQPMQNAFYPKPYPQVDPALYNTQPIQQDMEKVSGAQDAQQGSIQVQKTLGEAQIQQSGFQARTGARRDHVEDVLTEMAEYLAQIALQQLDVADAQRYAGPEAVWVKLSVEEANTLFDIEIKAGSTGKPQQSADKEAWGTLMPLIQDMITKIGQARTAGQEWAAKPWIALLNQTAMILDDRIDIESMLPVVPPQAVVPPGPPPVSDLDKAKVKEVLDRAYNFRATGVAALAAVGLPEAAGEDPVPGGAPGGPPGAPGGPDLQGILAPILAKMGGHPGGPGGAGLPPGPVATPDVPDPSAAQS